MLTTPKTPRPVRAPPAHWLKTRHLVLLVQLAEQRSTLAAARAVGMTQPAASKLLTEMESVLGLQLFVRHARGVEPTEFGKVLVRRARNALTEMKQAEAELHSLLSGISGRASIGTVVTSATNLVPLAVARLKQRYPQIAVSIDVDFSENLIERLIAGKLDIVIARIRSVPHVEGLVYEPLADDPHSVFARASHPLAQKRRVQLVDLARQAWVMPPPGNVLRDSLAVIFTEQGLTLPTQDVETAAVPVIVSLLREADMVSVLADEVVQAELEAGVLVRLPVTLPLRLGLAGIVTRQDHLLPPAAQALLETLRDTAGTVGRFAE